MADAMPTHPCIFCPKSRNRPQNALRPFAAPSNKDSLQVRRTAVPVFMGRVSPVLDTCTQLFVVEPVSKNEIARRTLQVKGGSIFERTQELRHLGVEVIICGAVSDAFFNLLREADIELVSGIAGEVDDVIDAYRNGSLEQPNFRMPGSG
jgi:predicted Fe-Mo cluster-binding NifX family protein